MAGNGEERAGNGQRPSVLGTHLLWLTSLIGVASFLYPFVLPALAGVGARPVRGGIEIPLVFTALGGACLLLILAELHESAGVGAHGASKLVALLGILVAIDATLRLVPTLLGASPIFLLIMLVGYAFGSRFGFLMGALTLFVSALITGGLGPWLPYQMLGAGWVGMTAGWLPGAGPREQVGGARGDGQGTRKYLAILRPPTPGPRTQHSESGLRNPERNTLAASRSGNSKQIATLAIFGGIWGFLYGAILNLMEWPFAAPGLSEPAGLYWVPGMSFADTLAAYSRFYVTTSLIYDAFRAGANIVLVLALGRPILRLFDRYRSRFIWQPWTTPEEGRTSTVASR